MKALVQKLFGYLASRQSTRPFIAVWLLVGMAAVTSLFWSGEKVDRMAAQRDEALVEVIVKQAKDRVAHVQEGSTYWDDALLAVGRQAPDVEWINWNMGEWFFETAGHDEVYLIDQTGTPVYAMRDGLQTDVSNYTPLSNVVGPLVEQAQASDDVPEADELDVVLQTPGAVDLALVRGNPAIVSAKPLVSDTGELDDHPATGTTHVSILYLGDEFANGVAEEYNFVAPRVSRDPTLIQGENAVALRDNSGKPITYLIWKPFAPGYGVARGVAPYLLMVLFVLGGAILLLARKLEQKTRDLESREAQAQYQALHDALTGLPNRANFERRLPQAIAEATKSGQQISLLFIDIDRFKQVNDQFGHAAGDLLIREVGTRLVATIRSHDDVFRLGGDEFAMILAHRGDANAITRVCDRIVKHIGTPFNLVGAQAHVGASVGVATAPVDGTDHSELTRKADIALYGAKNAGRGRAVIFDRRMDEAVTERADFDRDMRLAMSEREDQLKLHYQPIYAADSGKIVAVEALLRWQHPTKGILSPASFGRLAEDSGLIVAMARHVLEAAIDDASEWPGLRLAINVSPAQLRDRRFFDDLRQVLDESGFDPRRLEIEITEAALLRHGTEVVRTLERLRELGVSVALDDFGTGFSSLSHIREIAVDRVKIDGSFIDEIHTTPGISLIQAIVTMASGYGLTVTAEGVEDEAQHTLLRAAGCHEVQGFLLSRPLPPAGIAELLATEIEAAKGSREVA